MWVKLPDGVEAGAFGALCEQHQVTALPGARCALEPAQGERFVRVCFAFLEEDDLKEAGSRLGRALAAAARGELPAERAPSQAVTD